MYEQNDLPIWRRLLWLALGLIALVALIWFLVWLIFFRGNDTKSTAGSRITTTQQSRRADSGSNDNPITSPTAATNDSNLPSNTSGSASTSTSASSGTPSTSTPTALANTGPGNVIAPVILASVIGGTLYQVRLRRKLQTNL